MFFAYYKDEQTGQIKRIHATDYDVNEHKGKLTCADRLCSAKVHFQKASAVHGGRYRRPEMFVSNPGQKHRDGCTIHRPTEDKSSPISLFQALDNKLPILISLNIEGLMWPSGDFRKAAKRKFLDDGSQEAKFCNDNRGGYCRKSVSTTEELVNYLARLQSEGGKQVLERTQIAFNGAIIPLNEFLFDMTDEYRAVNQRINLNNHLSSQKPDRHGNFTGYPKLIRFVKKKGARLTETGIEGNALPVQHARGKAMIQMDRLTFYKPSIKQCKKQFDDNETVWVVARPKMNLPEYKRALDSYFTGQTGRYFYSLDWVVPGVHAIANSPNIDIKRMPRQRAAAQRREVA